MTALTQSALVLLLQSTGLLLLGLTALHLTRKRGPAVQTLIGRATLVGVALLALLPPLTGHIQPVWRIGPPAPNAGGAGNTAQEPIPQQVTLPPSRSALRVASAASAEQAGAEVQTANEAVGVPLAAPSSLSPVPPLLGVRGSSLPVAPTSCLPAPGRPPRSYLSRSKEVGSLWLTASLTLLLWLGVCQGQLTRLRRTSRPVTSGPATALLASLTPSPPRLLTHPSVHSPFLAGLRHAAIFLPAAFETQFDADALRAIFVHELAHEARRDNLWTLASRLLTALLWPQPLLWLLVRKLEQISEDACDEAVLAASCSPRAYADCLLSLATRPPLALRQRTLSAGVAPFRSSVGRRIRRILSAKGTRPMPAVTPRLRLAAAAVTLAAALGGAFLISSAPAQTTAQTTAPAPFVPTPQELRYEAERKQDLQNLKVIGLAIIQYTQDHHEHMPDAAHWMDQIASYRQDPSVFYDPFQPGKKRYGYALNRNCSGKSLSKFDAPSSTVAAFDSTLGTRNASDTGQSLRVNSSASSRIDVIGSSYGFVDGHAKWIRPESPPPVWMHPGAYPSFALDGGVTAGSQPPANPSVIGTWLDLPKSGLGSYGLASALIFSANGTVELIDTHPASTEAGHPYGSLQVVTHSHGRYTTAGPNLLYTLTRLQVEGKKSEPIAPQEHRFIYSIGGDTLTLHWNAYRSISRRVPAYKPEMLGIKQPLGAVPAASSALSVRQADLRRITAEHERLAENNPMRAGTAAPLDQAQLLADDQAQSQLLAGSTPVQGPGVFVTLADSKKQLPKRLPAGLAPPNIIHDSDINQVVNELKAAGAEAIAVNGQRLVATSSIRCVGPVVNVNNVSQAPPFIIKAIGDPKTLSVALAMSGGVGNQLEAFDPAMFSVRQAQLLTLPAYSGGSKPHYARPVGETAEALNAPIQQKLDFLRDTEIKMDAIRAKRLYPGGGSDYAKQVSTPKKQVTVTIDSKSRYFLDNIRVDKSQIEPRLAVLARQNPNITAVVKCSRNQPYARMIGLMDQIKHAGIQAIDIATLSSGPPSSTKPAGGSKPRYAKPVSTSGGMALNSIYEPTVVAALQEQYRSSQLLQMVISANLRALTAALKTTQRKMAQELDIFTPPLPPNAAEASTLRKSKSAYLRKWEALRDANLQVQAGLQSQIREETRQKLELHVQNVELYARISALKRFASSHQVH